MKPDYIEKDLVEESYWNISFEERLNNLERFTGGRALLDVGCGSGRFIKYATSRGWDCVGIEPSATASKQACADGLNVTCENLDLYTAKSNKMFDVVHLKNVLEHVQNPIAQLEICKRHLKPGGIIYVEVPNDFELFQRLCVQLLNSPPTWVINEHISYFNFNSLEKLLSRLNFSILRRDTTFPMYLFPLIGMNYMKKPGIGKRCHNLRMKLEIFLYNMNLNVAKCITYRALSQMGLGRTAIFYARKTDL